MISRPSSTIPLILETVRSFLKINPFTLDNTNVDGRVNSSVSEKIILNLIKDNLNSNFYKIPEIRSWYDILLYDIDYKWIPVNIKISNCNRPDNIGNLACAVQAFTSYELDPHKNYDNGFLSKILIDSFKNGQYNTEIIKEPCDINECEPSIREPMQSLPLPIIKKKKDYFFLIINKSKLISNGFLENEIFINSILSISQFTSNINNLPFQINWSKNREPIDIPISEQIQKFKNLYKTAEQPWSNGFINFMKELNK